MKENRARYVILGLLSHQPMSGYELKKYSTQWIPYFWDISYGQIYPALKQMNTAGLIARAAVPVKGKRAEAKTYVLTDRGRGELKKWLKNPRLNEVHRSELLLKLFFSANIEPGFSAEKISSFKLQALKHGGILDKVVKDLNGQINGNPGHAYFMFTAMFGEMYYKMCADWSDKVLKIIKKIKKGRD
jgi:PadR family transcriptional regulator AphA